MYSVLAVSKPSSSRIIRASRMTYNSSNGTILAAAVQGEMTFICVEFAETSQVLFAQAKWMSRCCFEVKLASRARNSHWDGMCDTGVHWSRRGDRRPIEPSPASMGLTGSDRGPARAEPIRPHSAPKTGLPWSRLNLQSSLSSSRRRSQCKLFLHLRPHPKLMLSPPGITSPGHRRLQGTGESDSSWGCGAGNQ